MIKKIVIVGGGFSGWYAAAALQHNVKNAEILVVDSEQYPILGVGESLGFSSPLDFERLVGLENDRMLMYETGAIYKLGIKAINFFDDNSTYQWNKFLNLKTSSLCNFYNDFDFADFDEPWNRDGSDLGLITAWISLNHGKKTYDDFVQEIGEVDHFCTNPLAPFDQNNNYILRRTKGQSHSYHIDAERSGWFLKTTALNRNQGELTHITKTVVDVQLLADGNVDYLLLEDGQKITADLFIDASGFKRVIMSRGANSSWCNRGDEYNNSAWVAQTKYTDPTKELIGATEFHGEDWGWRFKIKLYHRCGNGYIFNTNMVDPEVVLKRFQEVIDNQAITQPRLIQWTPGEYTAPWHLNLIPLGISSGLVDPWDGPTFDVQGRALEDLIYLLNHQTTVPDLPSEYNKRRHLHMTERDLRLHITFGLSQRQGKFWNGRRELFQKINGLEQLKDIILSNRTDIESRMSWHWHHQYIRTALIAGVDMSDWDFPSVPKEDIEMIEAFYAYNKQRNKFISQRSWPNYTTWLQHNRFEGQNNQQVLTRIHSALGRPIE